MRIMKVIDVQQPKMPQHIFDTSHKINGEGMGNGNDSYYPLYITDNPVGYEGHMEEHSMWELQEWCRALGAENGDTILINHWW